MEKGRKPIEYYLEIIDEIEKVRTRNNVNWMDVLRLAFKHSPEEAKLLMISNHKAKKELNWSPSLNFKETIKMTVEWYKECFFKKNIEKITKKQIEYFLSK